MAPRQRRAKHKESNRRVKKKVSILTQEKVEYVDYKDVNLLKRFMSDRAKVRARRVTGNDAQQQALVAQAIKNAREMALLPYTNRVVQPRGNRDRGGERGVRADGPPPRPSAPPPGPEAAEAPEGVENTEAPATTEEVEA